MLLADVNSLVMKELAEKLTAANLSAATIRDYLNNSKAVVASATDENGEELFPRRWNAEFIDAPPIRDQRQPSTNAEGMIAIVGTATGQYQMLCALLAGCGPMRAGEALGLDIDKHISPDFRTLYIRQKAKQGIIQDHLKTENGKRDVDLCRPLADMLRGYAGTRTSGLLFHTASGKQLSQRNILRACLHPILKKLGLERGGLNIRRFRINARRDVRLSRSAEALLVRPRAATRQRALHQTSPGTRVQTRLGGANWPGIRAAHEE